MKVLIENGSPHLKNMGDLAMLQVAVNRIRKLYPDSIMKVVTDVSQGELDKYCPDRTYATSIKRYGNRYLDKVSQILVGYRHLFNYEVRELVEWADVVVTAGGGYFGVNAFKAHSLSMLDTLLLAKKMDKRVIILGHGFSMCSDKKFNKSLSRVLEEVDYIFLREPATSKKYLRSLATHGFSHKLIVTGDDAIELAYENRIEGIDSNTIGVNIRFSNYTSIGKEAVQIIKLLLEDIRSMNGCKVITIPISLLEEESDVISTKEIGVDDDGSNVNSPLDVIQRVGNCKLVITTSYHAAVFALSQGIPVIGLAATQYYREKFNGLIEQFGIGCRIVDLSVSSNIYRNLFSAISDYWVFSKDDKKRLLNRAIHQIGEGYKAYSSIGE
ncbi:polysaccharide pyruvyl transferase family protein [Calothrix sp. FACHB-1219]|uniref:polysaccharide pyruvyl transferase family protein n=1 Tax=unclassified Calothrix TaxID=2619626 RepID=UPI0016879F8D|nr:MULTISPECIES: polysaccharide pyruvyl transferase family protein [unclassified Calothrix]MBD2201593.1 polysaccharide pyruvyl transferase family protein [Calothrix sp. FACHB-168]MBD2217279.1 polysaccharide pyruvyl transferase family protein [Calothrix sp. FACHB-1219]